MKNLNDLYLLMKEDSNESTVLDLEAELPVSLQVIFASLSIPKDMEESDSYSHKMFGDYVLEEYIYPILRNSELKCRMPIGRLIVDTEQTKEYKTEKILFNHKMDIEEFINIFKKEWELDQNMEIFTEFGISSIVWKDE